MTIPYVLPVKKYDVDAWSKEVDKYYASVSRKEEAVPSEYEGSFDPNMANLPDLLKMGIPANIAANWLKYIQMGGHFRKPEEVMKLYGMTVGLFEKVRSHLKINTPKDFVEPRRDKFNYIKDPVAKTGWKDSIRKIKTIEKKNILVVEVNKADSAMLESLPGIGPVLASRIIKYRRMLGGYYEVAQLKEVYGMSEELWVKSSTSLIADPAEIKKVDLNFLNVSELGRHPYIGFKQAKRVVRKRDTVGKFSRKEELTDLFSPDSLRHLLPYLMLGGSAP